MADVEAVGRSYRKILDELDELEREYKAQKKELTEAKETLEAYAKEFMQANNLSSLSTERVTFSIKEQDAFRVLDWDAFHAFVLERRDLAFLQKRVMSSEMSAFLEDEGHLPPGVTKESFIKVNHRRKN